MGASDGPISPVNRFYVEQKLTITIPETLHEHLHYSTETVVSDHGYIGGAAEVRGPKGTLSGVLVFFPSVSLPGLQGKGWSDKK